MSIRPRDPTRRSYVCPHCGTGYSHARWRSLPLLDRVDSREVGWLAGRLPEPHWIELRRCKGCEQAIPVRAPRDAAGEVMVTRAAAEYCGFRSTSAFLTASRRGRLEPWAHRGPKRELLWRREDLEDFIRISARVVRAMRTA